MQQVGMSLTISSNYHGQSTQNTPREQERQSSEETWRQVCDREGCTKQGEKPRTSEGARQYLIHLENTSQVIKPFVLTVETTGQLKTHVQDKFSLNHSSLGFLFSETRQGTFGRTYFQETIPEDIKDIFITVYLQKHTGFACAKN